MHCGKHVRCILHSHPQCTVRSEDNVSIHVQCQVRPVLWLWDVVFGGVIVISDLCQLPLAAQLQTDYGTIQWCWLPIVWWTGSSTTETLMGTILPFSTISSQLKRSGLWIMEATSKCYEIVDNCLAVYHLVMLMKEELFSSARQETLQSTTDYDYSV